MTDARTETRGRLGVRWGRATSMSLLGIGCTALLAVQSVSSSVFGPGGATLVVQGQKAEFSTAKLSTSNVGFGMIPIRLRPSGASTDGTADVNKYVLRMGFAAGALDGFCFSQTETIAGLPFTIRVISGSNDLNVTDVGGKNVQFDVTTASSSAAPNTSGNGIALRGNVSPGGFQPVDHHVEGQRRCRCREPARRTGELCRRQWPAVRCRFRCR
ncbi:DUF6230 family protein [Nocardioides sp. B-3]|uniref:DUF6230 family protein n=1 Tax=Nocardioides sp. B-3 TaxID=2895565 RepID=UPI0021534DCE|nr:DUF6230 family protein [Nocardioides sp. B-3]UUZ61469.1 DUF6230 family protein [Nocardioides sp. B-3]